MLSGRMWCPSPSSHVAVRPESVRSTGVPAPAAPVRSSCARSCSAHVFTSVLDWMRRNCDWQCRMSELGMHAADTCLLCRISAGACLLPTQPSLDELGLMSWIHAAGMFAQHSAMSAAGYACCCIRAGGHQRHLQCSRGMTVLLHLLRVFTQMLLCCSAGSAAHRVGVLCVPAADARACPMSGHTRSTHDRRIAADHLHRRLHGVLPQKGLRSQLHRQQAFLSMLVTGRRQYCDVNLCRPRCVGSR